MIVQNIELRLLCRNEGQVEGMPKNPRFIRDEKFELLKKSIQENPEMLGLRELLVYPVGERYVIIGGNMRYEACKALGYKSVPCKVLDADTPVDALKAYTIKDNAGFGEWDWDAIANEWDTDEVTDWGLDVPEWETEADEDVKKEKPEKNEQAEVLLNAAMKQYCGEFRQQLDDAMTHGWLISGYTRGYAKLKYLRAKYYGERYERKNAIVFAPEIFLTSSHRKGVSYYEQLRISASEETNAGIAGFRTVTGDGLLLLLLSGTGYPIGCGGSCNDFPVDVARELIHKYAHGGRVLDPCHGWGGRQVGALLEEVQEYVGVDPSAVANRAARDIYDTFGEYQQTYCRFIQKPYEETTDEEVGTGFDFALTSPPYFDVENYDGENQSHKRYNNYQLWVQKFYEPLILITMRRLKPDGAFALQVGSQTYPLRKDAEEICRRNGLRCEVIQTKVLNADTLHGTYEEHAECTLLITKGN